MYSPGQRFALGPAGYWLPVESGGRPLEDFVLVGNANGQGGLFMPREDLPSNWQPGMSVSNAGGQYVALPFQENGSVNPYSFHDFSTGPLPGNFGGNNDPGGLLGPAPTDTGGGLPVGQPAGTPPGSSTGGGLPVEGDPNTGGGPVSMPNPHGPVSFPNLGPPNARAEIERLRLAGLLDNLSINNTPGLRAPDYGQGPGVPYQHTPGESAQFEWVRNNLFGTWDPRQTRGGSNPYYNAPTSGPGGQMPPMQGPVIVGPNGSGLL
jgi:hypothetical protein